MDQRKEETRCRTDLLGASWKNAGKHHAEVWSEFKKEKNCKIEMTVWVCGGRNKQILGLVTQGKKRRYQQQQRRGSWRDHEVSLSIKDKIFVLRRASSRGQVTWLRSKKSLTIWVLTESLLSQNCSQTQAQKCTGHHTTDMQIQRCKNTLSHQWSCLLLYSHRHNS